MQPNDPSLFEGKSPNGAYHRPNGHATSWLPPDPGCPWATGTDNAGNRGNTGNTSRAAPKSFATAAAFGSIMAAVHEPLKWIVPGYLPEGLSILAGRQKLGKTWLALDWACAVGTGAAAMGNVDCEQGNVLYIDLENGERRIKRRLEMMFPYPPARPDLNHVQWADWSPELGPELIAELDGWRQSVTKARLIIIDVLQRIKPAGRAARNAYENDYAALADLQRWATEHHLAVLVLHHTRKGGADDPLEALSGSNGLSACADTTLVLDRTAGGITLYVRGRDVEECETALKFDNGLWSILGDADEWKRSGERSAILKVLKDADEPMSPAEIAIAADAKRDNIKKILPQMAKAGQLRKIRRGRYIHPDRADLAGDDDDNVVQFPGKGGGGNRGNHGNRGGGYQSAPPAPSEDPQEAPVTDPESKPGYHGYHGYQFQKEEQNQSSTGGASVTGDPESGYQCGRDGYQGEDR